LRWTSPPRARQRTRSGRGAATRLIWAKFVLPYLLVVGLGAAFVAGAGGQTPDPTAFVKVRDGRFEWRGQPFVLRGVNYFGSWRFPNTIQGRDGIEHGTIWAFYQHWDTAKVALDFDFLRQQLHATALRVGTPAESDLVHLVALHGYAPWYADDGSITPRYKEELGELMRQAGAAGLHIQLCLLWNVKREIAQDPGVFSAGGVKDRFYANQVRSIAAALRDRPALMAYSVGNEALVNWPVNGRNRSSYEEVAAGFIARRLRDIREIAPHQLLASDETTSSRTGQWYDPGPELVPIPGLGSDGGTSRLADYVDYLGTHFYHVKLTAADLVGDGFAGKLDAAADGLATYVAKARQIGGRKPIVLNEFGLDLNPAGLVQQKEVAPREALFRMVARESAKAGVQGLLAWDALPRIRLRAGDYVVKPSQLNRYSPFEMDIISSGRRILFLSPGFNLFVWNDGDALPEATDSAKILANAPL
jgi:hypothetical protein